MTDILKSTRTSEPENLFINEHLTFLQYIISYVLGKAGKDFPNIISGSTTMDGEPWYNVLSVVINHE